jgi:type I restriction-modification system DNA methylase subunit
LWAAADILRCSLDPADYRQSNMTLLFMKRLNDTFEENAEKLIKEEGRSKKEAYENKNSHYFFIPKEARWSVFPFYPYHMLQNLIWCPSKEEIQSVTLRKTRT